MATRDRPSIDLEERPERGSRSARRLRRNGYVLGILYGGDDEAISFKVGARDLRRILVDGAALFDVKIGSGKERPVIIKEEQRHPVREDLLHIDLLQVRLDEKIHSTVAIELEGIEEAPGVKEGGVLEHVTRELNIEALPTDIPERILVDVSGMEVAATLSLSEVDAPEGVDFLDDPEETTIATVVVPTEVEEPEEVEEETELVGEEGEVPEGEEAPEGEAPAEGDGGDAEGEGAGGDES